MLLKYCTQRMQVFNEAQTTMQQNFSGGFLQDTALPSSIKKRQSIEILRLVETIRWYQRLTIFVFPLVHILKFQYEQLECGNGKFISPFEYYYVIVSKQST